MTFRPLGPDTMTHMTARQVFEHLVSGHGFVWRAKAYVAVPYAELARLLKAVEEYNKVTGGLAMATSIQVATARQELAFAEMAYRKATNALPR